MVMNNHNMVCKQNNQTFGLLIQVPTFNYKQDMNTMCQDIKVNKKKRKFQFLVNKTAKRIPMKSFSPQKISLCNLGPNFLEKLKLD